VIAVLDRVARNRDLEVSEPQLLLFLDGLLELLLLHAVLLPVAMAR